MIFGVVSRRGWYLARAVFGSASALQSSFYHCDLWQGSHRSGNSGKILKTFSSQGNQGKTGVFQPKSGKKISNQGTFFPNHFQTF